MRPTQPAPSPEDADQVADRSALLAADAALVQALRDVDFTGPRWEAFAASVVRVAIPVMRTWLSTGKIFALAARKGRPAAPPDDLGVFANDIDDLVIETVSVGFKLFQEQIIGGKWTPDKGASLRTYLLNACVLAFPNVYRRYWRTLSSTAAMEVSVDQFENILEDVTDSRLGPAEHADLASTLDQLPMSDSDRKLSFLVALGYSTSEIAREMKLTAKSVERRLARMRHCARQSADADLSGDTPVTAVTALIDGATNVEIARAHNLSNDTVRQIRHRYSEGIPASAKADLWWRLNTWGIDTVEKARAVKDAVDAHRERLEDPRKRALYRPIPGINLNRLDLLLFHPDVSPPADRTSSEKENRVVRETFTANGARVVRDVISRLTDAFPSFARPTQSTGRKGAQQEFAKLYASLRVVTSDSTGPDQSVPRR